MLGGTSLFTKSLILGQTRPLAFTAHERQCVLNEMSQPKS